MDGVVIRALRVDGVYVPKMVGVGVTHTVRAYAFHDLCVLPPVKRPRLHVVITGVMQAARTACTQLLVVVHKCATAYARDLW